ncbi:LOB domain-containing protein 10-like [Rutidosis leptorrhynchoides]|uniref:LOB domain-containing protein 10-like n=1 Tax=Rutidosis leptorrhynchoides TaxID=125765 RepID=UPI003A99D098
MSSFQSSVETMYAVVKVKEKMSTNSPCAACKFLRRKCTQECVFAPYFPPDQPHKFANVHKVYGASNVAKLLNDLPTTQREDAVNSLAYEADARLRDPVYGCVGLISILQHRLKQVQMDLENAKRELANYIGPSAMIPIINQGLPNYNMQPNPVLGLVQSQQMVQDQHQQQHQLIEANDQQQRCSGEVLGSFNGGIDAVSAAVQVTANEFSHMTTRAAAMSPCLSLGGSYESNHNHNHNNMYHQIQHQPHHHHQLHQLFLQQQPLQPQGAE